MSSQISPYLNESYTEKSQYEFRILPRLPSFMHQDAVTRKTPGASMQVLRGQVLNTVSNISYQHRNNVLVLFVVGQNALISLTSIELICENILDFKIGTILWSMKWWIGLMNAFQRKVHNESYFN